MARHAFTTLGILLLAAAFLSCGNTETSETKSGQSANAPGSDIVAFAANDLDGYLQSSSQWIGKQPVVVNLWGTWCPPCRKEIPDLVRLYEEYQPKGLEIIGLAVRDTPGQVRDFAQKNSMNWVMLMADNKVAIKLGATAGVPTTIFFNRDGEELGRFVGLRSYQDLKKAFEAAMEESE